MQAAGFPVSGVVGAALVSTAFEAALVVDDASWRVVAATPSSEELYGGPLIGVALETLFALDQEEAVGDVVHAAESAQVEVALERLNGERRAVVVRSVPLELDGCTARIVALHDVTRERELATELARVKSFHRTLLDVLGIGVLTLDASGTILDHNHFAPFTRQFGGDLRSRNFFDDIVPAEAAAAAIRARLERYFADESDVYPFLEVFEFDAGGRIFEAEVHAGAHAGDADVIVRLTDATDRIGAERELRHQRFQAEEAARRSRLVYQTASLIHRSRDVDEVFETAVAETGRLLDASRCQIVLLTPQGSIRVASEYRRPHLAPIEPFADDLDSSPVVASAVRGLTPVVVECVDVHPQADLRGLLAASGARATLVAPIATGREARGILAIHDCDHVRHWTDADVELAASIGSQVGLAIAHTENLSSTARLLDAVTAAKRVWEGTFDAMADGIVVQDDKSRIVRANTAFMRLMKQDVTALVDKDLFELFSAENRELLRAARDRVASTRRHADIDLFEPATARHLSISVSRLSGESHPTFIYTVRDVTEGRLINERLTQSAKMASIGNLAAGVAHEINTPLATIAGSAQSLERQLAAIPEIAESPRWSAIADRLEAIVAQSFRCKRITHDLLTFAAPTRPQMIETDVARVVRDAVEMVERERVGAAIRVVEQGADVNVATDPELLRQVIINLAANALDAVEERGAGDVAITVRGLKRSLRIDVRDTGTGIADGDLDRVFDPFFTTKPPGRGTGLGLSISHNIVTSLGGRVEVASRVGRGSTFTVRLPLGRPRG